MQYYKKRKSNREVIRLAKKKANGEKKPKVLILIKIFQSLLPSLPYYPSNRNKMTVTFQQLYNARCDKSGNPHYWKPQPISATPFAFDGDFGIRESLEKILASSDYLEIDVREYTGEVWRKLQGEVSPTCKKLLQRNVHDETVHSDAIKLCCAAYPVSEKVRQEAQNISERWRSACGHPIQKAYLLEVSVFLACSLPLLLRTGGHSLTWVTTQISRDEQVHVALNKYLSVKLCGAEIPEELRQLRRDTVAWLTDGLDIAQWRINQKWFLDRSDEMVSQGASRKLTGFTSASRYAPPFEDENSKLGY